VLYNTRGDERGREAHRRWNYVCLPVDHPFWETHWPPNGWYCRCRVMSITQAQYDRLLSAGKITGEAPDDQMVDWVNKRTGEVSSIPAGISPAFDYNPGLSKYRISALEQVGMDKLDNSPAPIRQAAMAPVAGDGVSDDFGSIGVSC